MRRLSRASKMRSGHSVAEPKSISCNVWGSLNIKLAGFKSLQMIFAFQKEGIEPKNAYGQWADDRNGALRWHSKSEGEKRRKSAIGRAKGMFYLSEQKKHSLLVHVIVGLTSQDKFVIQTADLAAENAIFKGKSGGGGRHFAVGEEQGEVEEGRSDGLFFGHRQQRQNVLGAFRKT